MKNLLPHIKSAAEYIPIKSGVECRVLWESKAVREKRDNMKKSNLI